MQSAGLFNNSLLFERLINHLSSESDMKTENKNIEMLRSLGDLTSIKASGN